METFTLTNAHGLALRAASYGARIVSLEVPDRSGQPANVVLCYDSLERYLSDTRYLGAIVGRYANRIAHARFTLDGKTYRLAANDGPHHLHGGLKGLDKVLWRAAPSATSVALRYSRPNGEEGYPGTLAVQVIYTLTDRNELALDYLATTDKPTPVNLAQHSYFNLAGTGEITDHLLQIHAHAITPLDQGLIPTGEITPVAGTPFDFRSLRAIARVYDQNFVLDRKGPGLVHAARLVDSVSGRTLDVHTTEPGLQLYTGDPRGVCLETQHFPDSPNQPGFPSTILRPGSEYRSRTVFAFGLSA